jgi:hypothetical protein
MTDKLPKMLYHYTSFNGLIGILNKKTIWATKIHYQNDSTEILKPQQLARTYLEELRFNLMTTTKRNASNQKKLDIFKDIDRSMNYLDANIHCTSFCESGDLLSQWRGYGSYSTACSIGFDTQILEHDIEKTNSKLKINFKLMKCEYCSDSKYSRVIEKYIDDEISNAEQGYKNFNKKPNFISPRRVIRNDFISEFVEKVAFMKLNCFKEEKEWRLLSSELLGYSDPNYDFRVGETTIIPYYAIPLGKLKSIKKIIIGPNHNPELTRNSIMGLLIKYADLYFNEDDIKISKIPYRCL